MPDTPEETALAFDVGTRVIGVAIGNRLSGSARALTTLAPGDWTRVDALVAEWRPDAFVVGLPLTLDGGEQAMSKRARAFATQLEQRYPRPVHLVDERTEDPARGRQVVGGDDAQPRHDLEENGEPDQARQPEQGRRHAAGPARARLMGCRHGSRAARSGGAVRSPSFTARSANACTDALLISAGHFGNVSAFACSGLICV